MGKTRRNASEAADPFPTGLSPKLSRLAPAPPEGDKWLHEIKHDGYRLMVYRNNEKVTLRTKNGHNWTERFPKLVDAVGKLKARQVVLDGEVCAARDDGATDFFALQEAIAKNRTGSLVLHAFDLLYVNGRDMRTAPLLQRKEKLRTLLEASGVSRIAFVDHIIGHGPEFFRQCCRADLEGIISKRVDFGYKGTDWTKCKAKTEETLIVGGYKLSRDGKALEQLLLGRPRRGGLQYAGFVEIGLSGQRGKRLIATMQTLVANDSPFVGKHPTKAKWVVPTLKVEVRYSTQSKPGVLRHAVLREVAS